jgi:hypothetical protein
MPKIVAWTNEQAEKELNKRLSYAKTARQEAELEWKDSERILFGTRDNEATVSFSSKAEIDPLDWEASRTRKSLQINQAFKNHRFLHSQMAANPPTVVPRPTSSDPSDRQKADAADRLIRYAIRKYKMQERFDLASNNCLMSGTGILKTIFDTSAGEIMDVDQETGELLMEGEIQVTVPTHWDIYPDPDATIPEEIKWVFERIYMPYDECLFRFPDKQEMLKEYRIQEKDVDEQMESHSAHSVGPKYDVVEVYQYWERGLPHNGQIGRFCYCTKDGKLLSNVEPNPFRFSRPKDRGLALPSVPSEVLANQKMPEKAELPYHLFTDIDVPGRLWGRSTLFYEGPLQDLYNQMVNVMVDTLEAHGVPRLILPAGAEVSDESITNSPWDIIKVEAGQGTPQFMAPLPMPQAFGQLMQLVSGGIDSLAGVNDSMFGVQQREQSGFSMQYATNQGNMIRRRLFNKYILCVESVYKAYLNIIRKHWDVPRVVSVLGKEKAFESTEIKGADIDGGYDIVCEYGASLSLDPTSRREEILTMMPLFEKAGIQPRSLLSLMKLNELEGVYDKAQLASDRQRELFEEMTKQNLYIPPEELQDHKNMLDYAYEFLMTSEFKYLAEESKVLIRQHVKEREQLAAQVQGANMPGAAPGGMPGAPEQMLPGPNSPGAAQPPIPQMKNG